MSKLSLNGLLTNILRALIYYLTTKWALIKQQLG